MMQNQRIWLIRLIWAGLKNTDFGDARATALPTPSTRRIEEDVYLLGCPGHPARVEAK